MTASDIESPQSRASTGSRCSHALVTSVITLFVLLFGVTVTVTLFIRQIQTELIALTQSKDTHARTEYNVNGPKSEYKMQNFAFLRPDSGQLRNGPVGWGSGSAQTVGSGFEFDGQRKLKPLSGGSYMLYLDLALVCTATSVSDCLPVDVTVQVWSSAGRSGALLACQASSHGGEQRSRPFKCWAVERLWLGWRLVTKMEVVGDIGGWELDTRRSGMGVLLVDGPRN